MKKIIALIVLLAGSIFFFNTSSAQFTSTTCEGANHCSAPTRGVSYNNTTIYLGEQGEEFDLGFQTNFDKQRILLQEIFISENKNFSEEEIRTKIKDNIADIQSSNTIIINTSKFDILLQILGELHTSDDLNNIFNFLYIFQIYWDDLHSYDILYYKDIFLGVYGKLAIRYKTFLCSEGEKSFLDGLLEFNVSTI